MISVVSIQFLIGAVALAFTYTCSIVLSGYAQALVARWAGDRTPEEAGFLTLDPQYYIDWFGFLCTITIGFGWGKILPFRPSNVREPHRLWRVFAVYATQPLVALLFAFFAFVANLMLIGPASLCVALRYTVLDSLFRVIPVNVLAQSAPHVSSAGIVVALLLITTVSVNIFLALWSFVHNIWYHVLVIGAEQGRAYMQYAEHLLVIGPLLLFLLFGPTIRLLFLQITAGSAYLLAHCLGIV